MPDFARRGGASSRLFGDAARDAASRVSTGKQRQGWASPHRARISTVLTYTLDPVLIELAPSILSADFAHLADQVERATAGGASVIHVDIMDGHFVPNLTLGPPVVKSLRRATRLPLDCHLMIENPDQYIAEFAEAGADWISVHQEACPHLN